MVWAAKWGIEELAISRNDAKTTQMTTCNNVSVERLAKGYVHIFHDDTNECIGRSFTLRVLLFLT